MRFYEINPAVIPIAQHFFTYLRESQARIDIVPGDARTSLAAEASQHFDVLVVDAFSGDAIPLHLLTTQALELYKRHLAPGGILAFHISNQHVDLEPEVAQLAKASGMTARRFASPINEERGEFSATWMLLCEDPNFFQIPDIFNHAKAPSETPRIPAWTDDYSSLLPVLHW
jgi:spermidine synthase